MKVFRSCPILLVLWLLLLPASPIGATDRAYSFTPLTHEPDPMGSSPAEFTECGGWVWFTATVDGRGELWRSQGTPETTQGVSRVSEPSRYYLGPMVCHGGSLYYFRSSGSYLVDDVIMRTDAATGQTSELAPLGFRWNTGVELYASELGLHPVGSGYRLETITYDGERSSIELENIGSIAPFLGEVVVEGASGSIWRSDLTQVGTRRIWLETYSSNSSAGILALGSLVAWTGNDGGDAYVGRDSWQSVRKVAENVRTIKTAGGLLFLFRENSVEVWNPETGVTTPVQSLSASLRYQDHAVEWQGGLLYVALDGQSYMEDSTATLYWSDGGAPVEVGTFPQNAAFFVTTSADRLYVISGDTIHRTSSPGQPFQPYDGAPPSLVPYRTVATAAGLYHVRKTEDGQEPWIISDLYPDGMQLANIAPEAPSGAISGTISVAGVAAIEAEVFLYDQYGQLEDSVWTDSQGRYKFEPILPGTYYVAAGSEVPAGIKAVWPDVDCATSCEETAGGQVVVEAGFSSGPINLDLRAGASISGRVLDGATVVAKPGLRLFDSAGSLVLAIEGDASGNYRTRGLAAGTYFLVHSGSLTGSYHDQIYDGKYCLNTGCAPTTGDPIILGDQESITIDVQALDSSSTIFRGRVVEDLSGEPLNVNVYVRFPSGDYVWLSTDGEGYWTSPPLPPGEYTVEVAPGYYEYLGFIYGSGACAAHTCTSVERSHTVTLTGGQTSDLGEARIKRTDARLVGRVTDEVTGLPVHGSLVQSTCGGWFRTGLDGDYRIDTSAGDCRVYVAAEPVSSMYYGLVHGGAVCIDSCDLTTAPVLPLAANTVTTANFALTPRPGSSISGTVTDSSGAPLEGVLVRTMNANGYEILRSTDSLGNYVLSTNRTGDATLTFVKDTYSQTTVIVSGLETGSSHVANSTLRKPSSLVVEIFDEESNERISNFTVYVFDEQWSYRLAPLGNLALTPGRYTVLASANGYDPEFFEDADCQWSPCARATWLDLGEGETVTVTMNLGRSDWAISGRVVDKETGLPIEHASVRIGWEEAITDSDGFYQYGATGSGLINLYARAPGYAPASADGTLCTGKECDEPTQVTVGPTGRYIFDFSLPKVSVNSVSPARVHAAGGALITISVTNLVQDAYVRIGDDYSSVTAEVISQSPDSIIIKAPQIVETGWQKIELNFPHNSFVIPDAIWYELPPGEDYDGDRHADILWRNGHSGRNAVWYMDGATQIGSAYLPTLADRNWELVGMGDWNADSRADLLWRHSLTGKNAVWYMDGTARAGYQYLATLPDGAWQIGAVADFDLDGHADDILWRNYTTGENAIWYMTGATRYAYDYLEPVKDLGWRIVGAGDFDLDGDEDIVWRHMTKGLNALWYMDGPDVTDYGYAPKLVNQSWLIRGVADYDEDGHPDLLWRNNVSGENAIWYMENVTQRSYAYLPRLADSNWMIEGPR